MDDSGGCIQKDMSLIPEGQFCYQTIRVEVVDEKGYVKDIYSVNPYDRCPYWQRTDYGTVRCLFLGREVVDEYGGNNAIQKITQHFGEEKALEQFEYCSDLADEIKICRINLDSEVDE